MSDYELIRSALAIAKEAHQGQVDKAGTDYIYHPITVALLTNNGTKGTYLEYVQSIKNSGNALAIAVKKADLMMNMDITRIKAPTEADFQRIERKYKPALRLME